jgi:hypothetical protein
VSSETNLFVEGATGQLPSSCITLRAGASSATCELLLQSHSHQLKHTLLSAVAQRVSPLGHILTFIVTLWISFYSVFSFQLAAYQMQYTQPCFSAPFPSYSPYRTTPPRFPTLPEPPRIRICCGIFDEIYFNFIPGSWSPSILLNWLLIGAQIARPRLPRSATSDLTTFSRIAILPLLGVPKNHIFWSILLYQTLPSANFPKRPPRTTITTDDLDDDFTPSRGLKALIL